jgi:uncharacterized protein involved in cysteine biosynthesis
MVPTVLFLAFCGGAFVVSRSLYGRIVAAVARSIGHGSLGSAGGVAVGAVASLVLVALALVVALWVVPPLSAPFMDGLASRVDARAGREESLASQVMRSMRVALAGLVFIAVPQFVLAIVAFVVPPVAPLCVDGGATLGALGLAYDALDWPLSRRGLGVGERLAWMRDHPAVTAGLGLSAWAISLVPGLVIVALPCIVVGAVHVVNDVEAGN